MTIETILNYGKKYNIPLNDIYKVDTTYISFLFSLDTIKFSKQIKNHYQPLQVLYYNNYGNLKSFQVNCYAGGFPNLKWDRDSIFSTFIPSQQAQLDSILPLATHLKYLVPLSQTEEVFNGNADFVIVVHWNRFMGRQSKRLVKIVQDNIKLSRDKTIKIIYANNDNLFFSRQMAAGNTQ